MKKQLYIILLVMSLVSTSAFAEERSTDWTTSDTIMQVATTILLEIDREQTQWTRVNPAVYEYRTLAPNDLGINGVWVKTKNRYEGNPILGKYPSEGKINTYFISVAAGHALVSYGLRKTGWEVYGIPAVKIWQSIFIGVEASQVIKNFSCGVKTTF